MDKRAGKILTPPCYFSANRHLEMLINSWVVILRLLMTLHTRPVHHSCQVVQPKLSLLTLLKAILLFWNLKWLLNQHHSSSILHS